MVCPSALPRNQVRVPGRRVIGCTATRIASLLRTNCEEAFHTQSQRCRDAVGMRLVIFELRPT